MNEYEITKHFARLLLQKQQHEGRVLTVDVIEEVVESACRHETTRGLGQDERRRMVRELESEYQTVIGAERELLGDDEGWQKWLPDRKPDIDWRFWSRYEKYLEQGAFGAKILTRLDESTDKVLGFLGDPTRDGVWDRRGLVVGLVQSGKTAHYIGTLNKAVDAGYKVLVILTGVNENLRFQTQVRVEEGFLGYALEPDPANRRNSLKARTCGVGFVGAVNQRPDSVTTRKHDFKTGIASNFAIHPGGNPIVFVIKKNATVLRNLLNWVVNFASRADDKGQRYVKNVPLLVIDDESDVCSIDTRKGAIDAFGDPDPDHDPTKINKQIRKLLSLFDQSSYVGYTATPFANVLIHDLSDANVDPEDNLMIGEDLFPRSFIVSLPTPSNHVGPSIIFGTRSSDGGEKPCLPITREVDDTEIGSDSSEFWMPSVHRKTHVPLYEGKDRVPPSLRKAILSFILVCCERKLRGDGEKHNSMLIHVTRFVGVQGRVAEQVQQERRDIANRLKNNTASAELEKELWELWEDDFGPTTEIISKRSDPIFHNDTHNWEEIRAELRAIAESIQVRKIHGQSGEDLDYHDHKEGLNVIAIGGDKLSRGLTLDGLSVSYFLRSSRMYDTLMQMGRWFGYRPRYVDLCRLYTTEDLATWFSNISDATEELRSEFDIMWKSGRTPKDFGLRVRSHPAMLVTSAVKMRHGTQIQVCFQGTAEYTLNFYWKFETVAANWMAGERLVSKMEEAGKRSSNPPRENTVLWEKVSPKPILDFLGEYTEYPENGRQLNTRLIREYIEKEVSQGRLTDWTVLMSGGAEAPVKIGRVDIRQVSRGWKFHTDVPDDQLEAAKEELRRTNRFRIGTLLNPPDELVGLNDSQLKEALKLDRADWELNGKKRAEPKRPGGSFARLVRDERNGLLVLYAIQPDDRKAKTEDYPILGFVVSFPSVRGLGASNVAYTVNNVWQQEELDFGE